MMTLTEKDEENGLVADIRTTTQLGRASFTMLCDTRLTGEEWRFRNRYAFTR